MNRKIILLINPRHVPTLVYEEVAKIHNLKEGDYIVSDELLFRIIEENATMMTMIKERYEQTPRENL